MFQSLFFTRKPGTDEMSEDFKTALKQLRTLQETQRQINKQISTLIEEIYKKYRCRFLRVCHHCGQDGMDTIWECDLNQREVRSYDHCNILECGICEVIEKKKDGILNDQKQSRT
jgi:hypothetical protein